MYVRIVRVNEKYGRLYYFVWTMRRRSISVCNILELAETGPLQLAPEVAAIPKEIDADQRKTCVNSTPLKRSTGAGLRWAFASRVAPWSDETTKAATSSHSKSGGNSPAVIAARRQ